MCYREGCAVGRIRTGNTTTIYKEGNMMVFRVAMKIWYKM